MNSIPISNRPPIPWSRYIHASLFFIVFISGCITVNLSQFLFLLPLKFTPLYNNGIRYTKGAFGRLQSMYPHLIFFSSLATNSQYSCANGSHQPNSSSRSKQREKGPFHHTISNGTSSETTMTLLSLSTCQPNSSSLQITR